MRSGILARFGFGVSLIVAAPMTLAAPSALAAVKVHGATTVAFGLMQPRKADIEQAAQVELTLLPSSTTRGLADLAEGTADIAMLAEPLETAAEAINAKRPGLIDPTDYTGMHVGDAFVQFIVHPSNPLRSLTRTQLAALYSGAVTNWSEIGGANLPVLLVGEPTSSPFRLIRDALGVSYARDMRIVQNTNQTAVVVAQAPGALANLSTAHDMPERSRLKIVTSDVKIPLHLYIAIRKDARAEVKRAADAAVRVGHE